VELKSSLVANLGTKKSKVSYKMKIRKKRRIKKKKRIKSPIPQIPPLFGTHTLHSMQSEASQSWLLWQREAAHASSGDAHKMMQ